MEGLRSAKAFRHNRPQGRAMFIQAVVEVIADELATPASVYSRGERKSFDNMRKAAMGHYIATGRLVR
ncbi:hypothetical protein FMUBM48_08730 [Nocardia cyriacigeorgica]|nr:hypothetical protein FMUBM48_08730 [Nocardia cyriacigeorgica]